MTAYACRSHPDHRVSFKGHGCGQCQRDAALTRAQRREAGVRWLEYQLHIDLTGHDRR